MLTSRDDPGYRHRDDTEELLGDYELECQYCKSRRILSSYTSVGWVVGDTVLPDPANPMYGRCHKCSRYELRVIRTPIPPPPENTTGFTQIPQK